MITGVHPAGPRSLMVDFSSFESAREYYRDLQQYPRSGQVDAVQALTTVLLKFNSRRAAATAQTTIHEIDPHTVPTHEDANTIEIEVTYDGPDLHHVAEMIGMSDEALINWHSDQHWLSAFGGAIPGFNYCLPSIDEQIVPRLENPRTSVPGGSVALAGKFSAIYPWTAPGGWQLIGHTTTPIWDLKRDPPALIRPGDTVRYLPVRPATRVGAGQTARPCHEGHAAGEGPSQEKPPAEITVLNPGFATLVQDGGRHGYSDLGVSTAGAADTSSSAQANRLVGNRLNTPVLEILLGGLEIQAHRTLVVALAGAEVTVTVAPTDGPERRVDMDLPTVLLDGGVLTLGRPVKGARTYLSVRGGIEADTVLGSASTDTMSGLGPRPLSSGDEIHVADARSSESVGNPQPHTLNAQTPSSGTADNGAAILRFTFGPREEWFAPDERDKLRRQRWRVTPEANRTGIRLEPDTRQSGAAPLERERTGELDSEGMMIGSIQVPPSGNPVLFLNDHPVTGGYPVIGVVIPEDLPIAAQLTVGETVEFRAVDPADLGPLSDLEREN